MLYHPCIKQGYFRSIRVGIRTQSNDSEDNFESEDCIIDDEDGKPTSVIRDKLFNFEEEERMEKRPVEI